MGEPKWGEGKSGRRERRGEERETCAQGRALVGASPVLKTSRSEELGVWGASLVSLASNLGVQLLTVELLCL